MNILPRSVYADPHTVSPTGLTQIMDDLPQDQPLLLIDNLIQRIAAVPGNSDNLRSQLKQFEQLLVHADSVLKRMEKLLDQAKLPLDSANKTAASSADRLLKHFTEAYIVLSRGLGEKWFKLMYRRAHALATLRAAQLCYRRAMVAHRAYTNGSSRRWGQLQSLLAIAREHEFADQAV
ncbi:MAG TPA: hypothetical protein VFW00_09910, partial [Rhodocyclaceae bacterium]|nr:hypothetical protein [Rhodocyclaceae bacterium]